MSLIFGLIAAGCWGLHDFCVRFISQNAPVSACLLAVMVFGLLFQAVLLVATGSYARVPEASVLPLLCAGVSFAVANCGLYVAFQRGPVWLAAPLVACFSVFSIGISVIAGAQVSLGQWGAILVILAGIAMVAVLADRDRTQESDWFWTVVSALVAAAAFASTFAFGHAATELTNGLVAAMGTRVIAIGVLACGIIALRLPLWPKRGTLGVLAIMGVLDGVAILSIMTAADYPHPEYAAVATAIYGLPTIWLASVFLKERVNAYQWAGCLVAFCGIAYLSL
ncbi:EamA family transporter [Octadecabacter sp. 1_MG-2023]|uniref:EamA family transporter n=1 Tax=unclassified Octadecabacter TaxID=196158 RepID=UPI001C0A5748|nr:MULTISPECIES: EamA family transporter [unclassified Octadecabacter]MBU2991680.1 DMT family transporter [Octadecabacter sp. B2R22]MDO6735653.1 EamA family transporter [Octadecabacter sp. 1_MG-2023]